MKKILEFLSENFQFLVVKFSVYVSRRVFVMRNGKRHFQSEVSLIIRDCLLFISSQRGLFFKGGILSFQSSPLLNE